MSESGRRLGPMMLVRGLPGHPLHPPLTDATIGMYVLAGGVGDHRLRRRDQAFCDAYDQLLTCVTSKLQVVATGSA